MSKLPVSIFNLANDSLLIGVGQGRKLIVKDKSDILKIDEFIEANKGKHIITALSYDLKNYFENLSSENTDLSKAPLAIFWCPTSVYKCQGTDYQKIQGKQEFTEDIKSILEKLQSNSEPINLNLTPRISRDEYLRNVRSLQDEIQLGNIYEVNYCQEYYSKNKELKDPISVFSKWKKITMAPYSSYFQFEDWHIISGSPEMYIKKEGEKLSSSPIKGTKRRGTTKTEDLQLIKELKNDPKEQSENVMIVDLVRNDLSKIAAKNSVKVDELFGIYSFETVHQMISTISCSIQPNTSFLDILKATFPMGSMTGAPKIRAMELTEKHEAFKRGFYSGSLGYIAPNGDFDLNVLIRSLIYNDKEKTLSCSVGGAITIGATPEAEYEECNVKIQGIISKMYE